MFFRVFLCLFISGDCRDRGNAKHFRGYLLINCTVKTNLKGKKNFKIAFLWYIIIGIIYCCRKCYQGEVTGSVGEGCFTDNAFAFNDESWGRYHMVVSKVNGGGQK